MPLCDKHSLDLEENERWMFNFNMAASNDGQCYNPDPSLSWINVYQAPQSGEWKAISYTHVDYPSGDIIGKVLALASLVPVFLVVSFLTLILFRRELHTITYFGGVILNELINQILKYTIKSPRPCRVTEAHSIVYGMPSSHAQFMGFFSTYMACFLLLRLPRHSDGFVDNIWRDITAVGAIMLALVVSYSRIYLRYHTSEQVLAGLLIGIILALIWFNFTETVLTPLFPVIVTWPSAERFLIRDSTRIPNILWFEYRVSRMEARQRQRRASVKSK